MTTTPPVLTTYSAFAPLLIEKYENYLPTAFDDSMTMLQKVNKVINSLSTLGDSYNNMIDQWNTAITWVEGDGLTQAVDALLTTWSTDGTLDTLINQDVFGALNTSVTQNTSDIKVLKQQVGDMISVDATDQVTYPTLNSAVSYALANGIRKVFLGEKTYTINSTITGTLSQDLILEGNGATIYQNADVQLFNLTGQVTTDTATSFSNVGIDLSEESGGSTMVTALVVANASSYKVNDMLFIRDGVTANYEYASVRSVNTNTNTLYLGNTLRNTYPSVVIDKITPAKFRLSGVKIDTVNATEAFKSYYFTLTKLLYPRLTNVDIEKGSNSAINLFYCFGYVVENGSVKNMRDLLSNQTTANVGYGVNDSGSTLGEIKNMVFVNCRHGVTTNGQTFGLVVSDSKAFNCAGAGFDTHNGAESVKFVNCLTFGSWRGNRTDGNGFQDRGNHTVFLNCSAFGCFKGFYLFEGFNNSTLDTCKTYNVWYDAVNISGTSSSATFATINDSVFETMDNLSVLTVTNVNLVIKRSTLSQKAGAARSAFTCLVTSGSTVIGDDVTFDMKGYTGTTGRFIQHGTGSAIKLHRPNFLQGSASLNHLIAGDSSTGLYLKIEQARGDYTISDAYNVTTATMELKGDNMNNGSLSMDVGNNATTANFLQGQNASPVFILKANPTVAGAALTNFYAGAFVGQLMMIQNVNATNSLGVTTNGITTTIPVGASHSFIFDGTNWVA